MPTPTSRIVLQVSGPEYEAIKAAADQRTAGNVSELLRQSLRLNGIKVS